MNYFEELKRIADKTEDQKDKDILMSAAIQLLPGPEPRFQDGGEIPGWGYYSRKVY